MPARIKYWLILSGTSLLAACGGSSGGSVAPPAAPPPPPPPPAALSIDVQRVFPNLSFASPVSMVQAPGIPDAWYVVEKSGVVRVFDNDQAANASSVFVDISARVNDVPNEAGLLGIAFHPGFPSTPEVFLSYTASGGTLTSTVSRFQLDGTGTALDPASEEVLFTIVQPNTNHNGGDLAFGPDGNLYASFGDGGGGGDPGGNGQNTANLLGTIVRIYVDGLSPYEIPADNPFVSADFCTVAPNNGVPCPEIFAWGLRNPWRFSFDSATGNLWIGDVGQGAWEEVDRIDASQVASDRNFGWNVREGAHCYPPSTANCATTFIDPVTEYDRSLGQSITGGYVYRGSAISGLAGQYVFADFVQGRIFAVSADAQPTSVADELLDTSLQISTFAEDADGELYVINYGDGTIHQIVAGP